MRLSGAHNRVYNGGNGSVNGGSVIKLLIEGYDNDLNTGTKVYPVVLRDENSNIDYFISANGDATSTLS